MAAVTSIVVGTAAAGANLYTAIEQKKSADRARKQAREEAERQEKRAGLLEKEAREGKE